MASDIYPHIIIDFGSSSIKVGFNGESVPRLVIPNLIGHPKKSFDKIIQDENNTYFGYEALYNSASLSLNYPKLKNNGKISLEPNELKDIEGILDYIFTKKLKVKQDNYNVFIVDSLYTNTEERNAIAKILTEKFNIYNFHMEPQSIMTLYSTAKSSGLVVESGEIQTTILPIFEGFIIPNSIYNFPIAGKYLTEQFLNIHKSELHNVSNKYELAKNIKEKFIEILPVDKYDETMGKFKKDEFTLPDGIKINIGNERYSIPECLFNSENYGDLKGIHEIISESILKLDINITKEMFNNIILGGGNTMIKGFNERLKYEIEKYVNNKIKNKSENKTVKIQAFDERIYSAWIGASGICSFSQFQSKWITKQEYEEKGDVVFNDIFSFESYDFFNKE